MVQKVIFITSIIVGSINAIAITVDEILDKVEANEEAGTSKMVATQISYKADGRENVSKIEGYSMDKGVKNISVYTSPARIKGMKILSLNDGDDIWFYSPRTSRVRKIASHQKNQSANGSDFSYEDMSSKDTREDYNCTLAGEEDRNGKKCYKIEAKAKKDNEIYPRKVYFIDKRNFVLHEGEFYDENGKLWKKLFLRDYVKIGKYWTPKQMEMQNVHKGSKTVIKVETVEYDIAVDESMFSERYLRK
jgi:outer membrane lipoprotein-sorting protein